MAALTVKAVVTSDLKRALVRMRPVIISGLAVAVEETSQALSRKAQADCPASSGRLRDSHVVGQLERHPGYVKQEQGYTAPYAYAVHEGLPAGHPSKWLEHATDAQRAEHKARCAAVLNSALSAIGKK